MKRNSIRLIYLAVIVIAAINLSLTACEKTEDLQDTAEAKTNNPSTMDSSEQESLFIHLESLPVEELSEEEFEGLLYLREEEKLARDTYLFLYELFPFGPFRNIPKSEQQHMDAVKFLLGRYNIEDPAEGKEYGEFENSELQDLYNDLTESGSENVIAALKVGALIEETDIRDLQYELDNNVDNQDISFVYNNLLKGSENHLRAFTRVLRNYGVEYEPVILPYEYYKEIISE